MTTRKRLPRSAHLFDPDLDLGFRLIVGLVVVTAVWLLLMPVVPSIARATMSRFHLRGQSFAGWAMQQPIPAMYNFANRYQVIRPGPAGSEQVVESGHLNHFPVRSITFANGRYRNLRGGRPCRLQVVSSYRGRTMTTHYLVEPSPGQGYRMTAVAGEPMNQ